MAAESRRRRFLHVLLSLGSLLILAGCGAEDGQSAGPAPGKPPGSAPAEVGYIEVQSQTLDRIEPLPGRVVAYQVAEIRPQVSGIIQERLFKEGAYVEEGQQLYQIDPARYEADFQMAQANLENAEAQSLSAQALADRVEKLIQSGAVSEQQYIDGVSAFKQTKAAISLAEAEVRMAKINLDYTKVRAPISGYISPSSVTKGALVSQGQATPLATVRQLDPVYVDLSQSAGATGDLRKRLTAARLKNGGDNGFSVRLFPSRTDEPYPHTGTLDVAELAVDSRTGSIRLRSTFPNPDTILLPGMFVRASVVDGDRAKSIVIPQKAVTFEPEGGRSVWVIDSENKVRKRSIRTGAANDDHWIVLEGLEPGERVVVRGSMGLREGTEVKPMEIDASN